MSPALVARRQRPGTYQHRFGELHGLLRHQSRRIRSRIESGRRACNLSSAEPCGRERSARNRTRRRIPAFCEVGFGFRLDITDYASVDL